MPPEDRTQNPNPRSKWGYHYPPGSTHSERRKIRVTNLLAAGCCRCGAEVMRDRTRCLDCARKNSEGRKRRYWASKRAA